MRTEFVFGRPTRAHIRLGDDFRDGHAQLQSALTARSQLVWGEHCSECAYPSCYSSCDQYEPRRDGHCRRFEAGFEALAKAVDFKQVRFRKWGKVEAKGPVRAFTPRAPEATLVERTADRALGSSLMPKALGRKSAFLLQKAAVAKRLTAGHEAYDAFVLEAASGDGRDHALTLTILNPGRSDQAMFQAHIKVGPAYGRTVIETGRFAGLVDLQAPYLAQIEPLNEAEGRAVVFGFCDFVRWSGQPLSSVPAPDANEAPPMRRAKVLVWDLDETVWSGALSEDGLAGVRIRPEAVAAIVALDARGILQSIASKNDFAETMRALEHFGLADYFVCPQIGWEPKSAAIGRIAAALNLHVDTLVFIDDQAFERAEVLNAWPQIRVLDHHAAAALTGMDCFQGETTAESRQRRQMYRVDERRQADFVASGTDYRAFLAASGMTLTLEPLSDDNVARVYELSQRTNQLNFNGRKYREDEVAALRRQTGRLCVAMRCADRYGDYGLIGFAEADLDAGSVRDVFLSCRVQKKRVEEALFEWLGGRMRERGAGFMQVDYTPTERNAASRGLLERLGFTPDGEGTWSRSLHEPFDDASLVRVEDRVTDAEQRPGLADRWAKRASSASHDLGGFALYLGGAALSCF